MFKTRLFSSVIVAALMLLFTWLGGIYLPAFLLVVSMIGLYEFYRATGLFKEGTVNFVAVSGFVVTVIYYLVLMILVEDLFMFMFITVVFIIVMLGTYVFTFPKYSSKDVVYTFYGFFYVSVMLGFIHLTRELPNGIYIVWLIFISSWFCDVFAYLTGMAFGRHKLCPNLSPKKSVEGAIGGIVVPAICGGVYAYFIKDCLGADSDLIVMFAVLCALGAAVSQIGDLAASAIKRNFDIKDYGKLIPGHGGVLDRFDSVIFTAPMIYFIAMFMIGGM